MAEQLESITTVLADHRALGAAYVEYQKSIVAAGGYPDPPERWISKAACGELAKAREALTKAFDIANETAPKRQRTDAEGPKAA